MIARQTLHLSLTLPPDVKGESYNVADATYATAWREDWPAICEWFGLKGAPPPDDNPELLESRPLVKGFYLSSMDVQQKVDRVVKNRRCK